MNPYISTLLSSSRRRNTSTWNNRLSIIDYLSQSCSLFGTTTYCSTHTSNVTSYRNVVPPSSCLRYSSSAVNANHYSSYPPNLVNPVARTTAISSVPFGSQTFHQLSTSTVVSSTASSSTSSSTASSPFTSESEYHRIADETLGRIELNVTPLEDTVDGFDLSNAMGVLTIKLGKLGTYVINKQSANKQIWWSSPISGPRRYNYDSTQQQWVSSRDGHNMLDSLQQEIEKLTTIKLKLR